LNSLKKEQESIDPVLDEALQKLPQLSQVQYETSLQLDYLWRLAVRYGLYDAADCLRKGFGVRK
jgi:hypothetical protein